MKVLVALLSALLSVLLMASVSLAQDQQPTPTPENVNPSQAGMGHMDSMGSMPMGSMPMDSMGSMMMGPQCDVAAFVRQQQAYATALSAFAQAYQADPEAALRSVYNIGLTYQTFAQDCGYVPSDVSGTGHDMGHDAAADEQSIEANMELAMSIGDPENGQVLFNTVTPETGFACATCHRVDSTEALIGPGLVNVANPAHDPSQHEHSGAAVDATQEARPVKTMDEVVDYIRTSIEHPSAYVVPGFPDHLMPQVYAQILAEEQINDVIAYLLTLHE